MDIEIIKALTGLPVELILIYLIIRMQAEKEKIIGALIDSERKHALDLIDVFCGSDRRDDSNNHPSGSMGN